MAGALLSGVVLGAAFLSARLGFLAWFGFIPLLVALEEAMRGSRPLRASFRLGYGFGLTFFLVGTHWIAQLSDVAITVPWLKYPAWLAASAYLALFPGLAAALAAAVARRSGRSLALTVPLAFLLAEELRSSGELGFPWFQLGYTQHAYLPLVQMASLGSVTLVTVWVLLVNVLAWRALFGSRGSAGWASRTLPAAGAALALALPWLWGSRVLATATTEQGPEIALVQGNVAGEIKWSGRHQPEILQRFLDLSRDALAGAPRAELLVWPETATGSYLRRQVDQAIAVTGLAARSGVPVFSGFAHYLFDSLGRPSYVNGAGMFRPDGSTGPVYAKRRLVPFGERMPFQRWFPALGRLELGQAEWTPGRDAVLFGSAAGPFTCLVCFESIFPHLAREDVRRGARWLVNITNDEWFGRSAAVEQHAAMAVFRAVENRVPLARCANTGVTMLVDPYGRVTARLPVFEASVLVGRLSAPGPATLYTRVGDWPGWAAALWVVGLTLRRRRSAARGVRGPIDDSRVV